MPDLVHLIQQGANQIWLFVPMAILLGALHGLEPGHSKTMMAAFIVAVRGTPAQAALLGLSATLSHTLVVWLVALVGLHFGQNWGTEAHEAYFQLASGLIIIGIASWMMVTLWKNQACHGHSHDHHHNHQHSHHLKPKVQQASEITAIKPKAAKPALDAHAQAHADQIERKFSSGTATNTQVILFGLTGGLIPCPASITVLLLCLQLKQFALGVGLVLCFSVGLAITLVSSGLVAAWGLKRIDHNRFPKLQGWLDKAPYLSGALVLVVGLWVSISAGLNLIH